MRTITTITIICLCCFALAACGGSKGGNVTPCDLTVEDIAVGDPDGHPEPFGAAGAGEARAARITDPSQIVVSPNQQHDIRVDDFLLINDRIAVYVQAAGPSDGNSQFGGEIVAIDQVGPDGRPLGVSAYRETIIGLSNELINPDSVTVLNDGSDGSAAVIRVRGIFEKNPYMSGAMGALFSIDVGLPGYYDYVLEPGSPAVRIRLGLLNNTSFRVDLNRFELYGFFHSSRARLFTETEGFTNPRGTVDWVGFVAPHWSFATRSLRSHLSFGLHEGGFALFLGIGLVSEGCTFFEEGNVEIIAGGPDLDGLREAVREVDGDPPWRAIAGTVEDHLGNPVPDAYVHELASDGTYLSRTRTDTEGAFTIHAPDETVTLIPQQRGFPVHAGTEVTTGTDTAALAFGPTGFIHVTATDASALTAIPVRVQVIPTDPVPLTPEAYGIDDERGGRLHQHYTITGEAMLRVGLGEHRVIVSRGYEYEYLDTTVQVDATAVSEITAPLIHSVDTTGYLCGDFHVHTANSPDSGDPLDYKVAGQVADGLDLPVFSDHEWVTDPQPVVEALAIDHIAFGVTAYELTTFEYGHFNIIALDRRPDAPNDGIVDWFLLTPQETFDRVHALPEQPLIQVNHPRAPSVGGFFSASLLDRETGQGNIYWSPDFDLIEVFNGSTFENNRGDSVADWFALLEHGHSYVATGNSDNHFLRTGRTGYPRTCLYFGHDDPSLLTQSDVRAAFRSGDVFVSGGLYVNISGPGGERMGETVTTGDATVLVTATVQAPGWINAAELEVIVNGATQEVITLQNPIGNPGQRFVVPVSVPVDSNRPRTWVVLHAWGDGDLSPVHPGRRPFGVTNALFLSPQ